MRLACIFIAVFSAAASALQPIAPYLFNPEVAANGTIVMNAEGEPTRVPSGRAWCKVNGITNYSEFYGFTGNPYENCGAAYGTLANVTYEARRFLLGLERQFPGPCSGSQQRYSNNDLCAMVMWINNIRAGFLCAQGTSSIEAFQNSTTSSNPPNSNVLATPPCASTCQNMFNTCGNWASLVVDKGYTIPMFCELLPQQKCL